MIGTMFRRGLVGDWRGLEGIGGDWRHYSSLGFASKAIFFAIENNDSSPRPRIGKILKSDDLENFILLKGKKRS